MKAQFLGLLIISFFVSLSGFASSQSQVVDQLIQKQDPKSFGAKVLNYIEHTNVSLSMNLFSAEILKGIGMSAKYKYAVQSDFTAGYHTRADTWHVSMHINPGDILGNIGPVYTNLTNEAEIFYVRHFKTKDEALTALPRGLKNLPLTAQKAIENMYVGDFAAIPTTCNFMIGPQFGISQGWINASASTAYILSGEFTYQIFRVDDAKFRVKIYAGNSNGTGTQGQVSLGMGVIGISLVEGLVKSIFDLDILKAQSTNRNGHLLLADYVFNFSYPESREAYDALLASVYKFKDVSLATKAFGADKIDKTWLANMAPADDLSRSDRNKPFPRVERMFSGDNAYRLTTTNSKAGLLITHWRSEKTYIENFVTTFDLDGNPSYYFNPAFVSYERHRFGIEPIHVDHDTRDNIFAVMDSNADASKLSFRNIGMSVDEYASIYNQGEQNSDRQRILLNLGEQIFSKINWKEWAWNQSTSKPDDANGGRLYFQFTLGANTFAALDRLPLDQIKSRIEARFAGVSDVGSAEKEIISNTIYMAANDRSVSDKERIGKLMDLRRVPAFQKYGFGFVSCLLTEEELESNVWVDLMLFGEKKREVRFQFGHNDNSELYEQLRLLDATSGWERIDTRIFRPDPISSQH